MDSASNSPGEAVTDSGPPTPDLHAGERVVRAAPGVRLGWQARTVLIWWLPGLVFVGLGQVQFHSFAVTAGLLLFCVLLFGFYAQDSEVRPRAKRHYVLTDRRVLVGTVEPAAWREVPLGDIAATRMEHGLMDIAVARLSAAATIVLELNTPGPKGEPRRMRIGPMRQPAEFRAAIDAGRERLGVES